ncbi:hypothetical protein VB005_03644 [Metarhizium brunneum]
MLLSRLQNDNQDQLRDACQNYEFRIITYIASTFEQQQKQEDFETMDFTPENPTQTQQGPIDLNDLDDLVGTLTHEMRRRNPRIDPSQPELADLIANPSWLRRL